MACIEDLVEDLADELGFGCLVEDSIEVFVVACGLCDVVDVLIDSVLIDEVLTEVFDMLEDGVDTLVVECGLIDLVDDLSVDLVVDEGLADLVEVFEE